MESVFLAGFQVKGLDFMQVQSRVNFVVFFAKKINSQWCQLGEAS